MGDILKQICKKPIQLAEQVTKAAEEASCYKQECGELKSKTVKLAVLLRLATMASSPLFEIRPPAMIQETEQALHKALSLVLKCRARSLMKRMFTKIPAAAFRMVSSHLVISSGEIFGLLCEDIRKQIDILYTGLPEDRSDAAASLCFLASRVDLYRKLIIEEGGVSPLLKLLKDGNMEGQKNAARAIILLGRDTESVEHTIHLGVCSLFAEILQQGPMQVLVAVTWAVSELAGNYPKCQDFFSQHNIINLLIDHLAFVTLEEDSKCVVGSTEPTSMTSSNSHYRMKDRMIAARAIWFLAKDNSLICRSIAESKALLCFAVLLKTGSKDEQYNSAMAVMEITAVAAKDTDLRESAFNYNSPACKAIVQQVLRIIEKPYSQLSIPCIKTIGNLARTFKDTTETRIIGSLVRLIDKSELEEKVELTRETLIALTKFACTENDLHIGHSEAILRANGEKHLIRLVYLGKQIVRISALVLLSYIALHVPHSEKLDDADVLRVLEWASKQSFMIQDEVVEELLLESMSRLEHYQSIGPRKFHKQHQEEEE